MLETLCCLAVSAVLPSDGGTLRLIPAARGDIARYRGRHEP